VKQPQVWTQKGKFNTTVILIVAIVVIIGAVGSGVIFLGKEGSQAENQQAFYLTTWSATDYGGTPYLEINYTTESQVKIALINPNGLKTDEITVESETSSARLKMEELHTTPPAGSWKILAYDVSGKKIYENVLHFNSINFTEFNVKFSFEQSTLLGTYYLDEFLLEWGKWRWEGDLPLYLSTLRFEIEDDERDNVYIISILPSDTISCQLVLLPDNSQRQYGEVERFSEIFELYPGNYKGVTKLYDVHGNLVASYSEYFSLS